MPLQPIYDIAELCHRKGLDQVVLCPGSRCAPLTLAFARHGHFTLRTFSDERSAAFIALGIAQQTGRSCILIATSGTAAYNFAPAIAEAYFNHTPLLVLTADRPAEWIGQQDGQTLYQKELFGKHVKQSYRLPQQYDHADDRWAINRLVNEAINLAHSELCGPVHMNIPFREPFYPTTGESITYSKDVRVIEEITGDGEPEKAFATIREEWPRYQNILIVAGQSSHDPSLINVLEELLQKIPVTLAGDILSNLHGLKKTIRYADTFLGQTPETVRKNLQPDLLITFGKSVVSKNLKLFLRQYAPKAHWHIQPAGPVADTFQHMTRIIRMTPQAFFHRIATQPAAENPDTQKLQAYSQRWETEEQNALKNIDTFFPQAVTGEFALVHCLLKQVPAEAILHLANSMSVRYANFVGLSPTQSGLQVYCNRGTSGIDGCTSTAVGHCLSSHKMQVLITGDQAFFYDRNAFWHTYAMPNLRIVLLNNHGGAIFKMIDGPRNQPECDPYFVTDQRLSASALCREFGFEHITITGDKNLNDCLETFFQPGDTPKVLELETTATHSATLFDNFKKHIKKSYE